MCIMYRTVLWCLLHVLIFQRRATASVRRMIIAIRIINNNHLIEDLRAGKVNRNATQLGKAKNLIKLNQIKSDVASFDVTLNSKYVN